MGEEKKILNRVNLAADKLEHNIVDGTTLRRIQQKVLEDLKDAIIRSMGPAGSNSLILRGSSDQDIVAEYSKDGNKIIKNIKYQYPIEMAIKSEIENSTRYIEKTVGDGTSSVVVMSSCIFNYLVEAEENGKLSNNPYETIRAFKAVVEEVSEKIKSRGRECTIDDIYNISYISTNGNEYVASTIKKIYEDYGMDVFIDVSASSDENTYVKSYNGITIEAGYSDPAMINNLERNSCRIRSTKDNQVRVYQFQDPIDTQEMNSFFMEIIESNIMRRRFGNRPSPEIPTVILAPKIGRDTMAYMRRVVQMLHSFPEESYSQKPQLLIVTNYAGLDENYVDHISQLCNAKPIRKYIDDKQQKTDQESGLAPSLDTITEFCGYCCEVEADANITRFVDPVMMYEKDDNGDTIINEETGDPVLSTTYNNIITFLEAELKNALATGQHAGVTGSLKRQLNAIKANMVEIFVGGISISDRDSVRDLVEDAVLNCRSAAKYGVGYGANTMGIVELSKIEPKEDDSTIIATMRDILYYAYEDMISLLYATKYDNTESIIEDIIEKGGIPLNISTDEYDGKVITSIESEPAILDTISKIITIMFTANQAILQAPALSHYYY